MPANPSSSDVRRLCIRPGAAGLALGLFAASIALAQDPVIGPRVRIDVIGGTFPANETTASASEADPNVVVAAWNDWRRSLPNDLRVSMGVALSFDGGETWEDDFLVRPPKGFQTDVEGDPMTAFDDRTGALWVGAIGFSGNGGVFIARKDHGAAAFEPSVMADATGSADKCWMASRRPAVIGQRVALQQGISNVLPAEARFTCDAQS